MRAWAIGVVLAGATLAACAAILGVPDVPNVEQGTLDGGQVEDSGGPAIVPPSCRDANGPGISPCGPDGGESCCASLGVPGGTFLRSYDAVDYPDPSYPATVSAFRLDRFEVTVARFRRFVAAVAGGWRPTLGAGKHTHLNGTQGLAAVPDDAGILYETGWDISWNSRLALLSTSDGGDGGLGCGDWTSAPGPNEALPIGCMNWFEAFAFCIWDEGFLPSEAEWNYAAAGGNEQRVYPWSAPPKSTRIDCTFANYGDCVDGGYAAPGSTPRGDAKWGHSDMAGNMYEWLADGNEGYTTPCQDCVTVHGTGNGLRGAAFSWDISMARTSARQSAGDDNRARYYGLRCARTP